MKSRVMALVFLLSALSASADGFKMASSAFTDGGTLSSEFTCKGVGISPPLEWENTPTATKSLVVIVEDLDTPNHYTHWVLYNIPGGDWRVPQGSVNLPTNADEGLNGTGHSGYSAPCPPSGTHHYAFELYALDRQILGLNRPQKDAVLSAMKGHVLSKTQMTGLVKSK